MEIISRAHALHRQLSRYFTGKPCSRNHVTYRYTKNGGCADCVNPKFDAVDTKERLHQRMLVETNIRSMKRSGKMVRAAFRVHPFDLETFTTTLLFYSRLRLPDLMRADVIARRGWVHVGDDFQLRHFWIFPEDLAAVQTMERALEADRRNTQALDKAGL